MPRSELIIPITVALIAAIGSVIPVFINNPNIHEKPEVYVSTDTIVRRDTNEYQTVLGIGNSGSASATNVSLALASTIKIRDVSRLFSVTEVFIKEGSSKQTLNGSGFQINSHGFELYIPKLIPGTGSVIQVLLHFNATITKLLPNFKVLVVYDQGSTSTIGGIIAYQDYLREFWVANSTYYTYLSLAIIIALIIFWIYYRKRSNSQQSISAMIDNLLVMQRKLNSDIFTKELFKFQVSDEKKLRRLIKNVKDYIIISNLVEKLKERKEQITRSETNLVGLNWESLSLINLALDIDWDKYR